MKVFLFWLLTSVIIFRSQAQDQKVFIDRDLLPPDESIAKYNRTVEEISPGYLIRDYYPSGKIKWEMASDKLVDDELWTGEGVTYYEDGNKKEEGRFENGLRVGLHRYWYENGKPYKELTAFKRDVIYQQFWDMSGLPMIFEGAGSFTDNALPTPLSYLIRDGHILAAYGIPVEVGDTVYYNLAQPPIYKTKSEGLYRVLQRSLKYPANARRKQIQGKVFIEFIVNKEGMIVAPKVLKGVDKELDAEALRVASELHDWIAGSYNGRKVLTMVVLPINFKMQLH